MRLKVSTSLSRRERRTERLSNKHSGFISYKMDMDISAKH